VATLNASKLSVTLVFKQKGNRINEIVPPIANITIPTEKLANVNLSSAVFLLCRCELWIGFYFLV